MPLRAAARALHSDERGNITMFMVLGALALLVLVSLVANTGSQASAHVRMQNAADASATACATYIARGMNITAASNTLQTQLLAGLIISNAIDATYNKPPAETINQVIQEVLTQCLNIPYVGWLFIPPWLMYTFERYVNIPVMKLFASSILAPLSSPGKPQNSFYWKTMKALEGLSAVAGPYYSALALFQGRQIGRLNGATAAWVLREDMTDIKKPDAAMNAITSAATDGSLLPIKKGEFTDICDATWESPAFGHTRLHKYREGEGPTKAGKRRWMENPLLKANPISLPPGLGPTVGLFFPVYVDLQYNTICKGANKDQGSEVSVKEMVMSMAACQAAGGTSTWNHDVSTCKGPTYSSVTAEEANVYPKDLQPQPSWDSPSSVLRKPNEADSSTWYWDSAEATEILVSPPVTSEMVELPCGSWPGALTQADFPDRPGAISGIKVGDRWYRTYSEDVLVEPARDAGDDGVSEESPARPAVYWNRYFMESWSLAKLEIEKVYPVDNPMAGSDMGDGPRPYVLSKHGEELKTALRFVAAAGQPARVPWSPGIFETDAASGHVGYASAEVYCGVARDEEPDSFTQDWRVRLIPTKVAAGITMSTFVQGELGTAGVDDALEALGGALGAWDPFANH